MQKYSKKVKAENLLQLEFVSGCVKEAGTRLADNEFEPAVS